jgi:hypothetical protein
VSVPLTIQSDHGTETVQVFAVQKAFHMHSQPAGNSNECWIYGRSVHNQKIECFWSQMVKQWECQWQDFFHDLEWSGLWHKGDELEQTVLLYVFMPILREELAMYRHEYNSYPMRRNHLSRLPAGPPEDNYFLIQEDIPRFSVPIHHSWVEDVRTEYLGEDFSTEGYLDAQTIQAFDVLLHGSPWGSSIDVGNARNQYLYLRDCLLEADNL